MPKTLMIHIGAPKTGTSAFQRSLHKDRDFYHRHGIDECPLFFGPLGFGSRRDAVSGHSHFRGTLRNDNFSSWRSTFFKIAFEESSHQKFLISNEHFSIRSHFLHQSDFNTLRQYVDDVIVLYFVREPLSHAWSFYKEFCTWPDFTAVSFDHFIRFEYLRWCAASDAIEHYSKIEGIDFRIRQYPQERMTDSVLREFGIVSAEVPDTGAEPVYPSLPDAWIDPYVAQAKRLSGELKMKFNFALPELMQPFSDLPLVQTELPCPASVQSQRDYLASLGLLASGGEERQTITKFKNDQQVRKRLQSWASPDKVGRADQQDPTQRNGSWCLATLVKGGDAGCVPFIRSHLQHDFQRFLIFIDGRADFSASDFDDDRIHIIERSAEYWQTHAVDADIDSKILHCHEATRDFCAQHQIAWYFHADVDELLAVAGQGASISRLLQTMPADVNEITVNPFEVSFIYQAEDRQMLRPVLKRPTRKKTDIWKLQRSILVRFQRLILPFDRPQTTRLRPSKSAKVVAGLEAAQPSATTASGEDEAVSQPVPPQAQPAQAPSHRRRLPLPSPAKRQPTLGRRRPLTNLSGKIRPLAVFIRSRFVDAIGFLNGTKMLLNKRDFEQHQRLLPIKEVRDWYAKVLGSTANLTENGFLAHQAGKSLRRVNSDIWADNSHTALYKKATGRKVRQLPNTILIHDDCRTLEQWRHKFQSRITNPYLSKEMGIRRKFLVALSNAEPTDELYFQLYGIPEHYAEEGLKKGYLVEMPEGVTLPGRE